MHLMFAFWLIHYWLNGTKIVPKASNFTDKVSPIRSIFRLSYHPHTLDKFTTMLKDEFGDDAEYKLLSDFKVRPVLSFDLLSYTIIRDYYFLVQNCVSSRSARYMQYSTNTLHSSLFCYYRTYGLFKLFYHEWQIPANVYTLQS